MASSDPVTVALQRIPYGLYVIGSLNRDVPATMIANWVTQVSFHPPCAAVAVESGSRMHGYIKASGCFSVNLLLPGGKEVAKAFLKSPEAVGKTIGGVPFRRGKRGTPFLEAASAAFEADVVSETEAGDHVIFIGQVTDGVAFSESDGVLTLRDTGWRYSK
jgi:flavin reductase (DIM6/NTAB) family NADH-FMN oxidoreductase RutF